MLEVTSKARKQIQNLASYCNELNYRVSIEDILHISDRLEKSKTC